MVFKPGGNKYMGLNVEISCVPLILYLGVYFISNTTLYLIPSYLKYINMLFVWPTYNAFGVGGRGGRERDKIRKKYPKIGRRKK